MTQACHDILDARTKNFQNDPGVAYKLGNSLMYGMDSFGSIDEPPNEQEMSMWIPYADGMRRDGVGDLLEVGGIVTERHQKNAICLFDHGKHVVLPLGMAWARDSQGKYDPEQYFNEIDVGSQKARLKCFVWQGNTEDSFLELPSGYDIKYSGGGKEHALFCEQTFHMVCKRLLGSGSIGYQIIDGQEIPPDFQRGTPKGVHLRKVMMLEGSLVVLPANMDTVPKHKGFEWVREVLAMPKMCGKPLSPVLVKSLTPYAPEQTTTSVGFADIKSVPVPHGDLSKTDIPPAKWKPGVGAVKKQIKTVPAPERINPFKPGDSVVARKILTWTDKTSGKVDTFARTGDRLEVISVVGDGALATVRRQDGKTIQVTGASIRRTKGMPDESKSLDAIRKKYKQLRMSRARKANVKSHKFLIHCTHQGKSAQFEVVAPSLKDATEIAQKQSSSKCGMPASSVKRIKLIGPVKVKSLEVKGKAMEDDDNISLEEETPSAPPETAQEDWSQEPFGSQVLKRLHQDKSHLMKEYDGFMGLLDHEPTKGHLGSHMEYLEKFLGDTEKLHGKHYKHLTPIGGKALTEDEAEDIGDELEEQTADTEEEPVEEETSGEDAGTSPDDTVEADSSGDAGDEVSGEEALEGMEKDKKGKSLKVKKKGMCPDCGKEGCSCNKGMETQGGNKWGLQDHEMKGVGEANGFMGELSSTQNFEDEHRMKSYHYHKSLDGIGQMEQINDELNVDDVPPGKSMPGEDQWQQEEMQEPEHQTGPFVKACKDMSGWFKQLSTTRDFGDPHRKRCGMMYKAMADMMGAGTEEEAPIEGETEEAPPGDMGQMDEKALLNFDKAQKKRTQELAALAKQIAAIRL